MKVVPRCARIPQRQDLALHLEYLDDIFRQLHSHDKHTLTTEGLNLHFGTFRNAPVSSSEFASHNYTSKYLLQGANNIGVGGARAGWYCTHLFKEKTR